MFLCHYLRPIHYTAEICNANPFATEHRQPTPNMFPLSSSNQPRPPAASWKKLEESKEYNSGNVLREYQLEGVNWLLFNWYNRYWALTYTSLQPLSSAHVLYS